MPKKTILITGAGQGIGQAMAFRFSDRHRNASHIGANNEV